MKKKVAILTLIFSLIFCFGCSNNSNLSTKNQLNLDVTAECVNCYYLLCGNYGKRLLDRNALLTNTLYHLTNADIDSLNAVLPIVKFNKNKISYTENANINASFPKLKLAHNIKFFNFNKTENLNLFFNKTFLFEDNNLSYELTGVMLKPKINKTVVLPDKTELEQLTESVKSSSTTTQLENDTGDNNSNDENQLSVFSDEKLFSVNARVLNNENSTSLEIEMFETKNPENNVKLKFSNQDQQKVFVVNKNGEKYEISLSVNTPQPTVLIKAFNSETTYVFTPNNNFIDFKFSKINSNVNTQKTGFGRISVNQDDVTYVLSSDVKFVKNQNSIG